MLGGSQAHEVAGDQPTCWPCRSPAFSSRAPLASSPSEAGSERSGRYEKAPYGVLTCFHCKQSGHKATQCKQMREDARLWVLITSSGSRYSIHPTSWYREMPVHQVPVVALAPNSAQARIARLITAGRPIVLEIFRTRQESLLASFIIRTLRKGADQYEVSDILKAELMYN